MRSKGEARCEANDREDREPWENRDVYVARPDVMGNGRMNE